MEEEDGAVKEGEDSGVGRMGGSEIGAGLVVVLGGSVVGAVVYPPLPSYPSFLCSHVGWCNVPGWLGR